MVKQSIGKPSEGSEVKYKGVRKRKWGKWVSEIRLPNSRDRIWLGSYDSPEKAARAFDAALFCLRGRTAQFNFSNNPPDISGGRSLSPAEIQAEAARFANDEANNITPPPPPPQPIRSQSEERSMSEQQTEEESEGSGTLATDSCSYDDFSVTVNQSNDSFSDLYRTFGSGNYASEYGFFPGFDDLNGHFFSPAPQTPAVDYPEENVRHQESFLWNF